MTLAGLLNQTMTLYTSSGYGDDGRASHGSGVSTKCRFEPEVRRVMLPDGSILTIDATVIVAASTTVATEAKATYSGNDYKVVDVFDVPGGNGETHHKELRLVKWPHP